MKNIYKKDLCAPRVYIRRLIAADAAEAAALFADAGREYRFADSDSVFKMFKLGEVWGVFEGDVLKGCAAVCRADVPINICEMAMKTRLFKGGERLILPAFGCLSSGIYRFLSAVYEGEVYALSPVKNGEAQAAQIFAEGFVLIAMRPMFELRPTYIFKNAKAAINGDEKFIKTADTLALSRFLENGYAGVYAKGEYICIRQRI